MIASPANDHVKQVVLGLPLCKEDLLPCLEWIVRPFYVQASPK